MQRINALESLRGLMALWVVIGHTIRNCGFAQSDAAIFRLLVQPGLAVDVFIILSGFVIFFLLDARPMGYRRFITQRWFRLAPVYFAMLAVSVAMLAWQTGFIAHFPFTNQAIQNNLRIHQDAQQFFPAQLLMHVLMLHGAVADSWLPSSAYAFLGAAWSISVEWQFYLVAPLMFLCVARRQWRALVLALLAVLLLRAVNYAGEGFAINQAAYFLIGIGSYYLWKHSTALPIDAQQVELLALVGAALVYLVSPRYVSMAIWMLVLSCIVAERRGDFTPVQSLTAKLLNLPLLQWLGKISYSMYLVHMCMFYSVAALVLSFAPGISQKGLLAWLLPAVPLATIAVSALSYRFIEQPGMALGKRLSR